MVVPHREALRWNGEPGSIDWLRAFDELTLRLRVAMPNLDSKPPPGAAIFLRARRINPSAQSALDPTALVMARETPSPIDELSAFRSTASLLFLQRK